MLSFKEYLLEYLTDEQRNRYKDVQMTPEARKHTNHYFGEGNDQVKEDIPGLDQDKSEVHKAVERHLGTSIPHEHYRAGRFINKKGNQVRIGKIIKDKNLLKQFNEDNTRSGGKKSSSGHYATVVRGTEVAGQTNSVVDKNHPNGHSWGEDSCKNVDTGSNRHYLEDEIKHGSVVYRAHDHTGQEIYRATLHPYKDTKGNRIYSVNSEYGLKHPAFQKHAHEVARKLSANAPIDSKYEIHPNVYNDKVHNGELHPNATGEHINKALEDENWSVRHAAIQNRNVTSEHINKALNDNNSLVRQMAVQHPNVTSEHIDKALNDENLHVRQMAVQHPNVTSEHIDKALNDEDWNVRHAAIQNRNATSEHIDKALNDENLHVRQMAVQHPNVTSEHIDKALNDGYFDVRRAAIQNRNATDKHIDKALNDEDLLVRQMAVQHPNATSQHIDKALGDKDPLIKQVAQKIKQSKQGQ